MTATPFEEFLVAFEAGSPAERWRFMEWRLANRSDDEPDDDAGLDADEIVARAGITPEQSARFRRACAEARAFHDSQND